MTAALNRIAHQAAARYRKPWLYDDLVQGAWLAIVQALRRVAPSDAGYLKVAASRGALHVLKRISWPVALPRNQAAPAPSWTRVGLHEADRPVSDPEPATDAVAAAMALDSIAEPWRSTMRDHYLHDWPIRLLAQRIGIGTEGVRARLKKGRALLRAELTR